jgi:hypothetical protein
MIDSSVLNILRYGIHEENAEKLLKNLSVRKYEGGTSEGKTRSFMTSLGIGCVLYAELK